jgi:hypothetical protein
MRKVSFSNSCDMLHAVLRIMPVQSRPSQRQILAGTTLMGATSNTVALPGSATAGSFWVKGQKAMELSITVSGLYRGSNFVHLDAGPVRSWGG